MCQMDSFEDHTNTANYFTSNFDMQVTPPIDDTFDFAMIIDLSTTDFYA
jgi:hypothetical protein